MAINKFLQHCFLVFFGSKIHLNFDGFVLAQSPTPPPPGPWWKIPQEKIPYPVIVIMAVLMFIFGGLFTPLIKSAGSALQQWVKGWGKVGFFRQIYLKGVVGRCRYLGLLPANVISSKWNAEYQRTFTDLEELYTPLSLGEIRSEKGVEEAESWLVMPSKRRGMYPRSKWQAFWWKIRKRMVPSAGELGESIQAHNRLIIRGDPGSGKTTLLRYLAITCARSLRNNRREGDRPGMARERLGWKRPRFPILVKLGLFSDIGSWYKGKSILDAIVESLPEEIRKSYPKDFFPKLLSKGGVIILFDGFDELGSPAARSKMARLINDLATQYDHPQNRFIVTTRIVGYEGQLDEFGFVVRTVDDLDTESANNLVRRRYRAIALGEGIGRSDQEKEELKQLFKDKANNLLMELENNEGLKDLTPNPLLLTLIVLVSLVKVKLPEQRHILYRDCVEMLVDRWKELRKAEAGISFTDQAHPDSLSVDQKISILRDIALVLQSQRKQDQREVYMARSETQDLIADRMPDFIASYLPEDKSKQEQECQRRAGALLDDIREESGILVEQGLDPKGKPVIGFSHLTFQEYLAADALSKSKKEVQILKENLFSPSWREVLLLYMNMDAGDEIIKTCLADDRQLHIVRCLLAGRCLAEDGEIKDAALRRKVMDGLQAYFRPEGVRDIARTEYMFSLFGGTKRYDWLLENIGILLTDTERAVLSLPVDIPEGHSHFFALQQVLVRLMTSHEDLDVRFQSGCILSGIGDPREIDEMIPILAGEFIMGSDKYNDEKPLHRIHLDGYQIGKYPVTNAQYHKFVIETEHQPPYFWKENGPPPWLANHPVVSVTWHDAMAYCAWLSQKTGLQYSLPSEAEWEKAARGVDGNEYPWGNDFGKDNANTYETGIHRTTPAGCFPQGDSLYGCSDMCGNVWEWTRSQHKAYPYRADDGREDLGGDALRVLRGGSFGNDHRYARCAYRRWGYPHYGYYSLGFRVVVSPLGGRSPRPFSEL